MITAKIKCTSKDTTPDSDRATLYFAPDYQDGRNAEWAVATPALSLTMTVKTEVAERFAVGTPYTLTFTETED